jgi:rRNA maturation RNase YbeY
MKIKINNSQNSSQVNLNRIKVLITRLIKRTNRLDKQTRWGDIEVTLTDDARIAEVKKQVFDRSEITDVIALRYDPMPGIDELTSGEIFVNVQRAAGCTLHRNGWSPSKELALYLAHGCDHLAGASDDSPAEYNRMRRRELRWLREADESGLISNLIS